MKKSIRNQGNIDYYKVLDSEFKEKFDKKVKSSSNIILTTHIGPDDDAISSILAIYYYMVSILKINNRKVSMVITGGVKTKWEYFQNFKKIRFVDDLSNFIGESDLIIKLDGSEWKRLSNLEENYKNYSICIDHHEVRRPHSNLQMVVKKATSTAEVIYELFYADRKLKKEICEILLL